MLDTEPPLLVEETITCTVHCHLELMYAVDILFRDVTIFLMFLPFRPCPKIPCCNSGRRFSVKHLRTRFTCDITSTIVVHSKTTILCHMRLPSYQVSQLVQLLHHLTPCFIFQSAYLVHMYQL